MGPQSAQFLPCLPAVVSVHTPRRMEIAGSSCAPSGSETNLITNVNKFIINATQTILRYFDISATAPPRKQDALKEYPLVPFSQTCRPATRPDPNSLGVDFEVACLFDDVIDVEPAGGSAVREAANYALGGAPSDSSTRAPP